MIQILENFLWYCADRCLEECSQHLTIAKFVVKNAIYIPTGYNSFFINSSDHPRVLSILLQWDMSRNVEVVQVMVDQMKIALEAPPNIAITQANTNACAKNFAIG